MKKEKRGKKKEQVQDTGRPSRLRLAANFKANFNATDCEPCSTSPPLPFISDKGQMAEESGAVGEAKMRMVPYCNKSGTSALKKICHMGLNFFVLAGSSTQLLAGFPVISLSPSEKEKNGRGARNTPTRGEWLRSATPLRF